MRLSLLQIMEVTGGGEVGGTQVGNTFSTFHTDSREVVQGGVFFALKGAEMDGHRFVVDAIARGAAAVVVDRRMGIRAASPRSSSRTHGRRCTTSHETSCVASIHLWSGSPAAMA